MGTCYVTPRRVGRPLKNHLKNQEKGNQVTRSKPHKKSDVVTSKNPSRTAKLDGGNQVTTLSDFPTMLAKSILCGYLVTAWQKIRPERRNLGNHIVKKLGFYLVTWLLLYPVQTFGG